MSKMRAILVAAAMSAVAASSYTVASAAPVDGTLALRNAAPVTIEKARWVGWRGGGRGWRGGGWGWGVGAGVAAGALIGGALAAPDYYGGYYGGPYGYYGGYYSDPGYYAEPYAGGGDGGVEYCMQRYRSYDPNTGTFMGNDGRRHPCP